MKRGMVAPYQFEIIWRCPHGIYGSKGDPIVMHSQGDLSADAVEVAEDRCGDVARAACSPPRLDWLANDPDPYRGWPYGRGVVLVAHWLL